MADAHFSSSSLICQEDGASLEEEEEEDRLEWDMDNLSSFGDSFDLSESDDEYIGLLVSKESSFERTHQEKSSENQPVPARTDAVVWILKVGFRSGFSHFRIFCVNFWSIFLLGFCACRLISAWVLVSRLLISLLFFLIGFSFTE
jgi:hypothetical protein